MTEVRRVRFAAVVLVLLTAACTKSGSTTTAIETTPTPGHASTSPPSSAAQADNQTLSDPSTFDPSNPLVAGFVPRAVLFSDAEHGVIGGRIECPKRCQGRNEGILGVTHDGGKTWRVTERIDHPITAITAIPESGTLVATASACAYFFNDCGRTLLRSSDGGRTWKAASSWVVNPAFASADVGFGAGRSDKRAVTTDGGRTWATQPGPCVQYEDMVAGFSFPTSQLGWALCGSTDPGAGFFQFKAVYRTTDGGSTWEAMNQSDLDHHLGSGLPANGGVLAIHMFADGTGYVVVGASHAYLAHTVDGGRTWHVVWADDGGGGQELSSVSWLDESDAFAVRWDSTFGWTLVRTSDGGHNWATIQKWPRND